MTVDKKTPYGGINISLDAIASIAGNAAMECYGVVGLSSKQSLENKITTLIKGEDFKKGIVVSKTAKGYEVDVYIIVAFDLKITEVVSEVQKKVKYVLEKTFGVKFRAINVYVQGLK